MSGPRRILVAVGLSAAVYAVLGVLSPLAAAAHPMGNFTVNRYSGLLLEPGRIQITYVIDMAEIPTFQHQRAIDADGNGVVSREERQDWADDEARQIVAGIRLTVDGRPVSFSVRSDSMAFRSGQGGLPTLYCRVILTGALPSSGNLRYVDRNGRDRIGWKEVTAASTDGVALVASGIPTKSVSKELTAYPEEMLSSPLEVTEASFSFRPGAGPVRAPTVAPGTVSGAPSTSGGSFTRLVERRLTPLALVISLGIAFAFGAFHALGPGHGKTITAAYLVGGDGRPRLAIAAGVAVAVMHSISVLVLGLVALVLVRSFPAEHVYPWLGLLTGVVALCLGTGLLVMRIRANREGLGLHHTHGSGQGDHHVGGPNTPSPAGISWKGLSAIAVSGGVLPSPTALVVLTASIASHRIAYGLGLVLAFSLGLAAALVAVALVAIQARRFVGHRSHGRVGTLLPIASAAVIAAFGLFFCLNGFVQVT